MPRVRSPRVKAEDSVKEAEPTKVKLVEGSKQNQTGLNARAVPQDGKMNKVTAKVPAKSMKRCGRPFAKPKRSPTDQPTLNFSGSLSQVDAGEEKGPLPALVHATSPALRATDSETAGEGREQQQQEEHSAFTLSVLASTSAACSPFSDSPSTPSLASVTAVTHCGEAEARIEKNTVAQPGDVTSVVLAIENEVPPSSSYSMTGPPSMLGCLATCFGWRLSSFSFLESGEVQFALQHLFNADIRANVKMPRDVAAVPLTKSLNSDQRTAPYVYVNDVPVLFGDCALYLHQLTERTRLPAPAGAHHLPPHPQPSSLSSVCDSVSRAGYSPSVQPLPVLPLVERASFMQRHAEKRSRSRSTSPLSARPPPAPQTPPPSQPAVVHAVSSIILHDTTVHNEPVTGNPPLFPETPLVTATQHETAPKRPQRRKKIDPITSGSSGALALAPPPSSSSVLMSTAIKIKAEPVQPLASTTTVAPQHEQYQGLNQHQDSVSDDEPLASLYLDAAAAKKEMDVASRLPCAPHEENGPLKNTPSVKEISQTKRNSSVPSRSRRPLPLNSAVQGNAAMLGELNGAANRVHSPYCAPPTASHASPKRSFLMPYMLAVNASAGTSNVTAAVNVPSTEGRGENRGSNLPQLQNVFCGLDGWSTETSQNWLAHTHAMSRTFEVFTAVAHQNKTQFSALFAVDHEAEANGVEVKAALVAWADAVAAVRATLHQRWKQRSSLWSQMETSLRLSVGSDRLRGDALEAGVQALQASEEERQQYCGLGLEDDGNDDRDEEGGKLMREATFCTFPSIPPRPMLPVSGKAVLEAQDRISFAEKAEANAGKEGDNSGGNCDKNGQDRQASQRYVVYPDGIPAADRIVIDHTYTTRGSYLVVPPSPFPMVDGGDSVIKSETDNTGNEATERPRVNSSLPTLQINPEEDLHYHIYKRFLTKDMREALAAEGTLAIGPEGIGPVSKAGRSGNAVFLAKPQNGGENCKRGPRSEDDDRDGNESDSNDNEDGDAAEEETASSMSTMMKCQSDLAEPLTSVDIDYILRYRPAIRRIPMPDVESRYGL